MSRTMGSEVLAKSGEPAVGGSGDRPRRVLQIGNDWFAESAGGAARYYEHLLSVLGDLGVDVRGLIVGSDLAQRQTNGRVRAFARESDSIAGGCLPGERLDRVAAACRPTRDNEARSRLPSRNHRFALLDVCLSGAGPDKTISLRCAFPWTLGGGIARRREGPPFHIL